MCGRGYSNKRGFWSAHGGSWRNKSTQIWWLHEIVQLCGRGYSNKRGFDQHMEVHDETKAHKCDDCMKLFNCVVEVIQTKEVLISTWRFMMKQKHTNMMIAWNCSIMW